MKSDEIQPYIRFGVGALLVAEQIDYCERAKLGLGDLMRLRWVGGQYRRSM